MTNEISFLDFFKDIEDPRIDRKKLYSVSEILLTTLCAVISGAEGWLDVETFGNAKINFLRQYLPYENGVPSDDTFRRFFRAIDPQKFQTKFMEWVQSLEIKTGNVIAIDGKTSKRSYGSDKRPFHLISAFASEARIVLCQKKVDTKTNEITAIPELIEWLDLRGSIITIDAVGCQKNIASKIIEQHGNYVLALKGNQSDLHNEIINYFDQAKEHGSEGEDYELHISKDRGHGREETRKILISNNVNFLPQKKEWKELKSIVCVTEERKTGNKISKEDRYFISSLYVTPQRMGEIIRSHWAIENSLHWVLDMTFGDDQSRIRMGNGPENMAIVKHSALNMIRSYKSKRESIVGLRKKAGWDDETLKGILEKAI
jgi:predicted transposase YbfD/YdcC